LRTRAAAAKSTRPTSRSSPRTWPQYWDENGELARLVGVREIPTYVLLDAEGIEQLRVRGAGFHEARNLSAEIDRQITLSTTPRP